MIPLVAGADKKRPAFGFPAARIGQTGCHDPRRGRSSSWRAGGGGGGTGVGLPCHGRRKTEWATLLVRMRWPGDERPSGEREGKRGKRGRERGIEREGGREGKRRERETDRRAVV